MTAPVKPDVGRRSFLRSSAVAAIASATLATVAVDAAPAAQASDADAELLALCREFDEQTRLYEGAHQRLDIDEQQDELAKALEPIFDRQDELLERICALRAKTAAGIVALAHTLALYAPDWARVPEEPYVDLRLRAVLFGSALAGVA